MTVTREQLEKAHKSVDFCLKIIPMRGVPKEENAIFSNGSAQRPRITEDVLETIRTVLQSALDATDTNVATKTPDTAALDALENIILFATEPHATSDHPAYKLGNKIRAALTRPVWWMPMESAPKDGKTVFVFDNYSEDKKTDGYGRVSARFDSVHGWVMHQRYGNIIKLVNPVKWMPLPAAPKGGE